MKEIIYLCGSITDNKQWKRQFSIAYNEYRNKGYVVISPLKIYYMFLRTGKDLSKITEYELKLIPKINKLIEINLYNNKSFANIEMQYAKYLNKEIISNLVITGGESLNNLSNHYLALIDKLKLKQEKKYCREQPYVILRRCFIYYLRKKYLLTLKEIGKIVNLHHTSIIVHLRNYEIYKDLTDHTLVMSIIINYFNNIER